MLKGLHGNSLHNAGKKILFSNDASCWIKRVQSSWLDCEKFGMVAGEINCRNISRFLFRWSKKNRESPCFKLGQYTGHRRCGRTAEGPRGRGRVRGAPGRRGPRLRPCSHHLYYQVGVHSKHKIIRLCPKNVLLTIIQTSILVFPATYFA